MSTDNSMWLCVRKCLRFKTLFRHNTFSEGWASCFLIILTVTGNVESEYPKSFYVEDMCGQTINLRKEGIQSGSLKCNMLYTYVNECSIAIAPGYPNDYSWNPILFEILDFEGDDDTCINFKSVSRFDSDDRMPVQSMVSSYCDAFHAPDLNTKYLIEKDHYLLIRYWQKKDASSRRYTRYRSRYKIYFNLFSTGADCEGVTCDNGRCIDESLKCSIYNPCGDDSDCPVDDSMPIETILEICGGVLGGLAVIIKCISCCIKASSTEHELEDPQPSCRSPSEPSLVRSLNTPDNIADTDSDEEPERYIEMQPFYNSDGSPRTSSYEASHRSQHNRSPIDPHANEDATPTQPRAPNEPPQYNVVSSSPFEVQPSAPGLSAFENGERSQVNIDNERSEEVNERVDGHEAMGLPPSYDFVMENEHIFKVFK